MGSRQNPKMASTSSSTTSSRCAVVILLAVAISVCGVTEKDAICRKSAAKCVWLDQHLSRLHKGPLRDTLVYGSGPGVFCYDGSTSPEFVFDHFWDQINVILLTTDPSMMEVCVGNWSQVMLSSTAAIVDHTHPILLSPFENSCVRVSHARQTHHEVEYSLNAKFVLWPGYPLLLALGLFLFFVAPVLSRNVTLLYGTGITLGILASVLILLYILSRYIPVGRGFMGLGFLLGGYTIVASVAMRFFKNIVEIWTAYWEYVLGYVIASGLISFAVLYRWGGINNPRTFDLVQWFMQLVGLTCIFYSTQFYFTSIAAIFITVLSYKTPARWNPLVLPFYLLYWFLDGLFSPIRWCLRMLNPFRRRQAIPVRQLLTLAEYDEQGKVETEKALQDLQDFCKEANPVKVMNKLSDPERFARFLRGSDHVTAEERVNHDWTFQESDSEEEDTEATENTPSSSHLQSRVRVSSHQYNDGHTHLLERNRHYYYTSPVSFSGSKHRPSRR